MNNHTNDRPFSSLLDVQALACFETISIELSSFGRQWSSLQNRKNSKISTRFGGYFYAFLFFVAIERMKVFGMSWMVRPFFCFPWRMVMGGVDVLAFLRIVSPFTQRTSCVRVTPTYATLSIIFSSQTSQVLRRERMKVFGMSWMDNPFGCFLWRMVMGGVDVLALLRILTPLIQRTSCGHTTPT